MFLAYILRSTTTRQHLDNSLSHRHESFQITVPSLVMSAYSFVFTCPSYGDDASDSVASLSIPQSSGYLSTRWMTLTTTRNHSQDPTPLLAQSAWPKVFLKKTGYPLLYLMSRPVATVGHAIPSSDTFRMRGLDLRTSFTCSSHHQAEEPQGLMLKVLSRKVLMILH
jgi:hypothetical protein